MKRFKTDSWDFFKDLPIKRKVRSLKKDIKKLKYGLRELKFTRTKETLKGIIFCFIRKLHYYERGCK